MMKPEEMIKVIQGYIDGKEIQYRMHGYQTWNEATTPTFSFNNTQYRIKPQKKEGWINIYKNRISGYHIHSTKEKALRVKGCGYTTTIKIEWEE